MTTKDDRGREEVPVPVPNNPASRYDVTFGYSTRFRWWQKVPWLKEKYRRQRGYWIVLSEQEGDKEDQ